MFSAHSDFEGNAISLDATLEAAHGAPCRKDAQVRKLLAVAQSRLTWTTSQARSCLALLSHAFNMQEGDFESLLPFLGDCQAADPTSIPHTYELPLRMQVQQFQNTVALAKSGALRTFFEGHPEVESWIGAQADRLRTTIREIMGSDWNAERTYRHILIISVELHDLMAGLTEFCITQNALPENSFVGRCVHDIRRSLDSHVFQTVLREMEHHVPCGAVEEIRSEVLRKLSAFCAMRIRPENVPPREEFFLVRKYLDYLKQSQWEYRAYAESGWNREQLPLLARTVEPEFTGTTEPPARERTLPWGQLTLIRRARDGRRWIAYVADGVANSTAFAVPSPPGKGISASFEPTIPAAAETWPLYQSALSCRIDGDGKVLGSPVDRFAPLPDDDAYRRASATLLRADYLFNEQLRTFWADHPDIVAELPDHGPFVCIRLPNNGTLILCRTSAASLLADRHGCSAAHAEEAAALLSELRIDIPEDWTAVTLPPPPAEPETCQEGKHPTSPRFWRRQIRHAVGKIPSLQWIVDNLQPFGDVELTSMGKGSHGSLLLVKPTHHVHRQTIWRKIEGTESLHWTLLWEFLERLGIDYRSFYESLTAKHRTH